MSFEYIEKIKEIIQKVETNESESITNAIELMTQTIKNKNNIYAFGASHAGIITMEMYYRAGGLVLVNPIFAKEVLLDVEPITQTSKMESLEGYGKIIAEGIDFQENDLLIVHSVSGRNPVAIDLVLEAKNKGVKILSITNVSYSKETKSRHSSGKRLYEVSDIVIDNHGVTGDAIVEIPNTNQTMGPSSTVIGSLIVNTVITETIKKLEAQGMDPLPIFYSANIDGGKEKNDQMMKSFKDRIKYKF